MQQEFMGIKGYLCAMMEVTMYQVQSHANMHTTLESCFGAMYGLRKMCPSSAKHCFPTNAVASMRRGRTTWQ
jgi:hypothetical protein